MALFIAALACCHCERIQRLRAQLRGTGPLPPAPSASAAAPGSQPPAAPASAASSAADFAPRSAAAAGSLKVTVVPPTGISILLDGVHVADASPFVLEQLAAGEHVLHVRAMGHHSVTLPIAVVQGQALAVPVALRVRPPTPTDAGARPATSAPATAPAAPAARERGARAAAGIVRAPLPPGAAPLWLRATCQPPGALLLDGVPVRGPELQLPHGRGQLSAAGLSMAYRIRPGHVLELTVPHDDAAWFKDGQQLKATSVLRLEGAPTRLRRVAADGAIQVVVLHRL